LVHIASRCIRSKSCTEWALTFGFEAKYERNSNVPKGELEFTFKTAGLEFESTSYQWRNATTGAVVYDNQINAAQDAAPTTAIVGGTIRIHKENDNDEKGNNDQK
jgi:hypothetical protein